MKYQGHKYGWSIVLYTLLAVYHSTFGQTINGGVPCCTNTSASACCIHPRCPEYDSSDTCQNIHSSLFTFILNATEKDQCSFLPTSTPSNKSDFHPFTKCVEKCPEKTYNDLSGECMPCHRSCINCTGNGNAIKYCECAHGNNRTHCCPVGTKGIEEKNVCKPLSSDVNNELEIKDLLIPILAGAGAGVAVIMFIIVLSCCCCTVRRTGSDVEDGSESGRRVKRPISQLLFQRFMSQKRKNEGEPMGQVDIRVPEMALPDIPTQPDYANIEVGDGSTLARDAQKQHDKTFRYIKDPTNSVERNIKKEVEDRPVSEIYVNDQSIRLQIHKMKSEEGEEIAKLPVAPPVPNVGGQRTSGKKIGKSKTRKHKVKTNVSKTLSETSFTDKKQKFRRSHSSAASSEVPRVINTNNQGDEVPYANMKYPNKDEIPVEDKGNCGNVDGGSDSQDDYENAPSKDEFPVEDKGNCGNVDGDSDSQDDYENAPCKDEFPVEGKGNCGNVDVESDSQDDYENAPSKDEFPVEGKGNCGNVDGDSDSQDDYENAPKKTSEPIYVNKAML